ncbi:hypothetical protein DVH24_031863 [Malus domestica]|uniref:Uncharacterized protein n=1 Tax=Malus domestica TaxID=3750 RepID=A0A498J2V4_MALDO|nr:hypothetical protein DVH24_031863 [Malus domestica]
MPRTHIPVMDVGTSPQISAGSKLWIKCFQILCNMPSDQYQPYGGGGRYKSPPAAHKCIFHLLNILGVLLQVKHATGNLPSPFVTDHNTVVMLIAVLLTYVGTLKTANILQASNNTNIYELMNNISLLCGTLALVLLVLLLVPAFGGLPLHYKEIKVLLDNVSLLSETLAFIMLLYILVPTFRWFAFVL